MNCRPKSEEPVRLFQRTPLMVPRNGFRVLEGFKYLESGRALPIIHRLLFLEEIPGAGSKAVTAPEDLYLEFARAPVELNSVLSLAGRYGFLGEFSHFHHADGTADLAEPISAWQFTLSRIKHCFDIWLVISNRDRARAEKILIESYGWDSCPRIRELGKKDPVRMLAGVLTQEVSGQLNPALESIGPCSYPGCDYQHSPDLPRARVRQGIRIEFGRNYGRTGLTIGFVLSPFDLCSTLWLQLAIAFTGQNVIKRCEICGEFMDVTSSARPGAKRMHDRCSITARVRRYRKKKSTSAV